MRYVVTGAAGFIGSHLAEALQAAGHEVVGPGLLHRLLRPRAEGGERARPRRAPARPRRGRARLLAASTASSTSPGSPACAASATSSRSTCGATCSRASGSSRPRPRRGVRVVFASSSSVYGDAERYPTPGGHAAAADLALRDHEARVRAPGARLRPQLRARRGRAALLQRLRAPAAAGHGVPAHRRGARPRAGRSRSSATAARAAASRTSATSSRRPCSRWSAPERGRCTTSAAGRRRR